ncbi:hypothetical protein V7128_12410 [Neobacillus vireti]|uniref:hypothetical protein n=1 Tax=Neobacillus vireti TaxID=220686 RepID=UPI002FFE1033
MDINQLEKWIENIKVKNIENADVEVENNSPLVMIGKGRQGAVFQLPDDVWKDDICVKVFGNQEDCEREYYALSLGRNSGLFPWVYAKGPLYIAMELIKGVDVREYLQSQPLTPELSFKLIEMLITFKEIGFERIDHHKRQIFIQPDGNLKVIDVARTVWRDRVYPYPRKLLTSLGEKNKEIFLAHVKEMAPELFAEWEHYIRMEELSRSLTEKLLLEKSDHKKVKEDSKKLITTDDEAKHLTQLKGLIHKVFKEEWVKVMLARGVDLEAVMEKIDNYWDNLESRQTSERNPNSSRPSGSRYSGESSNSNSNRRESSSSNSSRNQSGKRYEGERNRDRHPKGGSKKRHRH